MINTDFLIAETDGGARGNPGIAAAGVVILADSGDTVIKEVGIYLGIATNNIAEYSAIIVALRLVDRINKSAKLTIKLDSKLVAEQMSGNWKVRDAKLGNLFKRAKNLSRNKLVNFQWIPREKNTRSDNLVNLALDLQADFANFIL